jgi:hypothetical protein
MSNSPQSNIPVPDPSLLTTAALFREIGHVRELYDTRLEQLDLRLQQRFEAQSKALDAALESANAKTEALADKIDELRSFQFSSLGRAAAAPTTSTQIAAIADRVDSLATSRDASQGRSVSNNQFLGYLIGGSGAVIGLVLFILQVTGH